MNLNEYEILKQFQSNGRSVIYLARHLESNEKFVLKGTTSSSPSIDELSRLYNEFEICKQIPSTFTKILLEKSESTPYLIRNYIEGETLKSLQKSIENDFSVKLTLAISIAEALSSLHMKGLIHKDISPQNIIISEKIDSASIIDFEFSSIIEMKSGNILNQEILEGTLTYISPEQTGRMNRTIDHRSDLYSFGVVMFELFTGKTPFESNDPLELVHCHIAKTPSDPSDIDRNIPSLLSKIILKLLAKNAEDRYQTAIGICNDLKKLRTLLSNGDTNPKFQLGLDDTTEKLTLTEKLYGRESELHHLMESFNRSAAGHKQLVLIAGFSGVGKTSIVNELYKPITERRGLFISGKFDQLQKSNPYSGWLLAFKQLAEVLLTENQDIQNKWSAKLNECAGSSGRILTDLIPKLELIMGKQPDMPELSSREALNRTNYILRNFIGALASKEQPLVVFLDDMQWADSASLALLKNIISDPKEHFLQIICAYRENEVSASHPFMSTIHSIEKENLDHTNEKGLIQKISINNLERLSVNKLIADALHLSENQTSELTDVVYSKTQGNAFFVNEFLKSLNSENLLIFNQATQAWEWDTKLIKQKNITDNVVELMSSKINKLPLSTRLVLQLASCIGNRFDLKTLSLIYQKSYGETARDQWHTIIEGLTIPESTDYRFIEEVVNLDAENTYFRFVHDRIQQAVYASMSKEERELTHYRIGKILLNKLTPSEIDTHAFEIANHLNIGIEFLETENDRDLLFKLNIEAGKKAKKSAAFETAHQLFNNALNLVKEDSWVKNYALTLELYNHACESANIVSGLETLEELSRQIFIHAKTELDTIKAHEIRIVAYANRDLHQESINEYFTALKKLGVHFPNKASRFHIIKGVISSQISLRNKTIESLENLPEASDPVKIAAIKLLARNSASFYLVAPNFIPLNIFKLLEMTLKYGISRESLTVFGSYGLILCSAIGDIEKGYKFGQLMLKLYEKYHATEQVAFVNFLMNFFIRHWKEPLQDTFKSLQEGYIKGIEVGDVQYSTFCQIAYFTNRFFKGEKLGILETEIKSAITQVKQFNQKTQALYFQVTKEVIERLMIQTNDPTDLNSPYFEESIFTLGKVPDNAANFTFFAFKQLLGVMYYNKAIHLENVIHTRAHIMSMNGAMRYGGFLFFESIGNAHWYDELDAKGKKEALKTLEETIKKFKKFSSSNPSTFSHRYYLLEAEYYRIKKNKNKAELSYKIAVQNASNNHMVIEEAMVYEVAAHYYRSTDQLQKSQELYTHAYNTYIQWGANAKASYNKNNFISLTNWKPDTIKQSGISETSNTGTSLDVLTFIKSAEALSSEIVLNSLLEKLMHIALENAGAQSGFFIQKNNQEYFITAMTQIDEKERFTALNLPVSGCHMLSESVVNYVANTKESLLIEDAQHHHLFSTDPIISKNKTRSLLCIPFINQGQITGIIYMTNNLVTGAFTEQRINLLKLLAGQIAVSIENAMLYGNLEQKVKERTSELENEKRKSDRLLLNILPPQIADELKAYGSSKPRRFEQVTVLFADFVSFTKHAEKMSSEKLVNELDTYFKKFDEIIIKHKIEKIKTIGDAYMCAAGIPVERENNFLDMVEAAYEIVSYTEEINKLKIAAGEVPWEIRIGINTGPVIAGIVGSKKFAYDIWGDAVNTASRIEHAGKGGKINISGSTYHLIKDYYDCQYRGKVFAKNKGEIDMYFLLGKKTEGHKS